MHSTQPAWRPSRQRIAAVLAAILLLVEAATAAQTGARSTARSFLWRITSGTRVLYLAGSVHALGKDAYPLAAPFDRAFEQAGTLVEEIDLGTASPLAAAPLLLSTGMYQDGRTFASAVSPETAARVNRRLDELGIPSALVQSMKPWMVMLTLTSAQLVKSGLDPDLGLDKHFYDRAVAAGKPVMGLETLESQIGRFDTMSPALQEQMLLSELTDPEADPQMLTALVAAWRRGDEAYFEKTVLDDVRKYPAAYTSLIVERNQAWLPQIDACLTRPSPCFVIVGAAHLVGPDGLLEALRKKGYRIEQQ